MENKRGKYLKYAIGEILLVMIGILLALQVNNWNENRKLKLSWKIYTESLIKDLKQDTLTLNYTINFINNDSIQLEKIMLRLSSAKATLDTLKKITRYELNLDSKAFRPPNNTTFLAMQNNGTFELFDEETYSMLLKLHTTQRIAEQIIQNNNAIYADIVTNVMSKYSSNAVKTIAGPLADEAWRNVDADDLFRTVQGTLTGKKLMNKYTGLRYAELLTVTEEVLNRLIEISE